MNDQPNSSPVVLTKEQEKERDALPHSDQVLFDALLAQTGDPALAKQALHCAWC